MKRGGPRGGSGGSPENEAGVGQCCEPVGSERCPTAAAVRFRPLCLPPSGRVSRSKCHRPCRGVPSTPSRPALAASLSLPVSSLASQSACELTSIPLPGPASTTPVGLRPAVPASSSSTALKPEVRASHSGLPRRMRDGTSGASTALRGGSERVGAPEPRALPQRGTQPGDCSAGARWFAGCLGERAARPGVSGRPQRR